MITAVFDCMVFLQAATSEGPAFACLEFVEERHVALHVSPTILAEVRNVLSRPKIRAKFPHLTEERVDFFLQKLAALSILAGDVPNADVSLRDTKDLPYLHLAVNAGAGYLVSWDKDLRDLMQDAAFVSKYPALRIVNPVEFLAAARPPRKGTS